MTLLLIHYLLYIQRDFILYNFSLQQWA